MKKIFTLVITTLLSVAVTAQWKQLNPKPSGYINTNITFIDRMHGYLFNNNGELYRTSDSGNTWQLHRRFPNSAHFALKDSTGMIGVPGGLYLSRDNGQTWQKKDFNLNSYVMWTDIVHRDTLFAVVGGGGLKLYRSTNRGDSWTMMNDTIQFLPPAVDFVTPQVGFAVRAGSGIFKTSDGGRNWKNVYPYSTSARVTCVQFADSLNGYAYRETGSMLKTVDGGKSWTTVRGPGESIHSIFIVNTNTAYAAGDYKTISKTVDGGASWSYIAPGDQVNYSIYYSQYFFNDSTGFVVGMPGRILKTTNGGASWTTPAPTYIHCTGLSMVTPGTGYATTWWGTYKTIDSGNSWKPLAPTLGTDYTDYSRFDNCVFFNADTGLISSSYDTRIFRTVNGGQSFDTIRPFAPYHNGSILTMHFINSKVGYLTGGYAIYTGVMRTNDGGLNWQKVGDTSIAPNNKMFFTDVRNGYGIRYNQIVQTKDSGKTWSVSNFDFDTHYLSLWFFNAKKGFVTGENAMLKMTNDSGRTWEKVLIDYKYTEIDFLDIRFFNDSIGYISGENGMMFKTIDGGLTWKSNGKVPVSCQYISFASDSTVYVAGLHGNILKNSIYEFGIDSLQANGVSACNSQFSALVNAEFSTVDSVWFEYGTDTFDQVVKAAAGITDTTVKVITAVQDLVPNTAYRLRIKIMYRGQYHYGDEISFNTDILPKPVIIVNNYLLTSSADSGNQWYRNDTLIAGATGKQYAAGQSGSYMVRVTKGNCISSFSDSITVTIAVTGIIDPVLNAELKVYPNPVAGQINIRNDKMRRLSISATNITGQQVLFLTNIRAQLISLPVGKLANGLYFIQITDLLTKQMVTRKLVKVH